MDVTTATTISNVAFLIFIAFVVWAITRPARTKPARTAQLARELAELDAGIASARREVVLLRDDVGRLRGALGVRTSDGRIHSPADVDLVYRADREDA